MNVRITTIALAAALAASLAGIAPSPAQATRQLPGAEAGLRNCTRQAPITCDFDVPPGQYAAPAEVRKTTAAATYVVAPGGDDAASGTAADPWATLNHAQDVVVPGDTVYLRGGTYDLDKAADDCAGQTDRVSVIPLTTSGTSSAPITYAAYPGERPILDFSRVADDCRIKGIEVTGSWLRLQGLNVREVPQNNDLNRESWGIWVSGSNNRFERIDTHHHMGPGLFIQNGGGNLVLNCDSHDNYDARSTSPGGSADGFGAHIPAGNPGNVFRGNRAWDNTDDGFDLISAYSSVLIEDSWSWHNGFIPGTETKIGDGHGFKAGGYGGDYDPGAVKHTVRRSVAFDNKAAGFYANHHPIANDFFNNTGYDNHPNFNMLGVSSTGEPVGRGRLRNNIAYAGTLLSNMSGTDATSNSWNLDVAMTDAQFRSVSTDGWDAARASDGSLPELTALHLASDSDLIDAGVDVGLPYAGRAPDVGAFEAR